MNREVRIQIAKETLQILEKGFYTNRKAEKVNISESLETAVKNSILYKPLDFDELERVSESLLKGRDFKTEVIEVSNEGTIECVLKLRSENMACLNFASAKNPGGGFLNGSQAQEESLARASGLFPCINQMQEMYSYNKSLKTCLYSDYMIFSKNVPVIRDSNDALLENFAECSIITAPAVNAGVVRQREPENISKIEEIMRKRIRMILNISVVNNIETLILGAWGCGVFQNDPEMIASLFYEQISNRYTNKFKKIVFAVLDKKGNVIEPFRKYFTI